MEGILIGTAILWALGAAVIGPLASWSVQRAMEAKGVELQALDTLDDEQRTYWKRTATGHYVLWDVLVLGTAGLIGGLLGYYFIGISLDAKGWPGMAAFIGASVVGVAMVNTA